MDLLNGIKNGDETAFEQAYSLWRKKGFYYFLRKTQSEEDAKDLLQNTFLKLWQYRNSLNPQFSLDQQLFHIARNVFIDYLRKLNNIEKARSDFEEKMTKICTDNQQHTAFDTKHQLQLLLNKLPAVRKQIFLLHRFDGYNYKEIANKLAISEKSVDNHLAKATKMLRKAASILLTLALATLLK